MNKAYNYGFKGKLGISRITPSSSADVCICCCAYFIMTL